MTDDELSTSDVLIDVSKNLCNLFQSDNDKENDEAGINSLQENLYYTESEFSDFIEHSNISNANNLTIISVNIANLLSKLGSLKRFLTNINKTLGGYFRSTQLNLRINKQILQTTLVTTEIPQIFLPRID